MRQSVKNKRGIPIPTRILISGIVLLLQLGILFVMLNTLSDRSVLIYTVSEILAIITVVYIVNRRGNPSYKMAWIMFILIVPIFGITVFMLYGGGRVLPHLKRKMRNCESHNMPLLKNDEEAQNALKYDDYPHSRQAEYLARESGYPLYKNTSVEYLSPGEVFLPRFLEELEKAERYIFLEFFIVAEGEMFDSIYAILRRKAAAGVDVRLLFDDFGSIKRQRKGFIERLRRNGIKVAVFNQIKPSFNLFMNNRNHRKIAVIDGAVAVTGGLNLADEYINAEKRFGYWMDCAVILKGEAASSFAVMFCNMWEFTTGHRLEAQNYLTEYSVQTGGYVLPYCNDPLSNKNVAAGIYMQILNSAQRYVYIISPYLIIDNTMTEMLKMAARSGIDVRIITPHVPDKWYVHPVTQYSYSELLEAGVRIFEFTPGFIHSKIFVSDDSVATVGTVNMDYRSFSLHFECGVWFAANHAVGDVKSHFDEIQEMSREIKLSRWRKTPWPIRLKRSILHLFAPFM
ncbi:MAG: cardiolipin synthase [Clostridia bacterium]|nr:cardiolipin synthase [Clostridia bacterium]